MYQMRKKEETEFDTIRKFEYFDKIKNESNKISCFFNNTRRL